ncbi:MAG: S-layer homology domain-containing protein [Clostridia bacterium]|nr:S-layer homology domain-containing protein [Clostridia bacterium]
MKSLFKKSVAVILTLLMISGSFVCGAAAELNQDAVNKHYGQYKNYVLLGDSIASGYREAVNQENISWNWVRNDTAFVRAEDSYSDIIANSIIEDKSLTPFAAPAVRTIEIRYMLEDDFEGDQYLFHHPFTIKSMGKHQDYKDEYRAAVANADLITLGVGGNDWGQFLSWAVVDITAAFEGKNEYVQQMKSVIENSDMDMATVEKLLEICDTAELLPYFIEYLPQALNYGLENFYKNWDIMIEDIYRLNPDVTLMVVGMSDTGYTSEEKEETLKDQAMHLISEAILSIGNKPMKDGAEKYGYTYVDITGATYIGGHPDANGHRFIANKIIEALPDPVISKQFDDVKPGHKYYSAVEYVVANGIMSPTTETTFSPDEALTAGDLNEAMNAIVGTDKDTEDTSEVSIFKFAISLFTASFKKGVAGVFKGISLAFKIISDNTFNLGSTLTRGEAAEYLKAFGSF